MEFGYRGLQDVGTGGIRVLQDQPTIRLEPEHEHAQWDGLDDRTPAFFAVAQLFLSLSALGDVQMRTADTERSTVGIAGDDPALVEHPDPVTVLVSHTVFGLKGFGSAFEVGCQGVLNPEQVVRMDQ